MIPRQVNVVWVGGGAIPAKEIRCIDESRANLADYELRLWTDDDVPQIVDQHPGVRAFVEYAYSERKWAFLADMVKMYVLAADGGWVMDADNEFVSPPTPYERHHWVSGFENWRGILHPITAIMGSVPQHEFSRLLFSVYANNDPARISSMPNTHWISHILLSHGCRTDGTRQYVEPLDVELYPYSVFCAKERTRDTVAFHHFSGSWLPDEA